MLHLPRALAVLALCMCVLALAAPESGNAQSISLDPDSVSVPPPVPAGPCLGGFSADGDIFDATQTLPLGPPGCGLGWPGPASPANLDAFASGQGWGSFPLPVPAGTLTLQFSVDETATGDTTSTCKTAWPGALPPDVGTEACSLEVESAASRKTTDAPSDIYSSSPNASVLGLGPVPGSMLPHYQVSDGNGVRSFVCPFPPAPGTGREEAMLPADANQPIDDVDAFDFEGPASGPFPFDDFPADGIGDVPLYYSVDPPTAAAAGFLPDDVFVAIAGTASVYAPGAALGLPPGNDIDGLAVFDVAFDGVYAPGAGDRILYSVSSASPLIGALDCHSVAINAGDILTEGTPLGFAGVPCILIDATEFGLWKHGTCGANPATGSVKGDELDAFDILPAWAAPLPVCGPTPLPDASCNLNDVSGVGKSSLFIRNKIPRTANVIYYKWKKGVPTTAADFRDPTDFTTNVYRLCIYDSSANPQPIYQRDIADNSEVPMCGTNLCWNARGNPVNGYKYQNSKGDPRVSGGFKKGGFKSSATPGKSKLDIKIQDRFSNPPDTLPIDPDVVVQLLITDGVTTECFKTTFPTAKVTKQTATDFKVSGP